MSSTITPEESLVAFKRNLTSKGRYDANLHDDYLLYRFLRARKYNLEKAELMFTNYLDWRIKDNVDDIVNSFSFEEESKVHALYPRYYHKTDKIGRTVYVEQLKSLDVGELFKSTTTERLTKKHIREFEKFSKYRIVACGLKAGVHLEQGLSIMDLKGVPLSQFNQVRKVIQLLSSIAADYYPETLGKMFLINCPTLFTAVWAVIKSFLDETTVAKISILGSNYKKQLLEHIAEENLPASLGGKCECPGGCENSDIGPWNDGTVAGYPDKLYEGFKARDSGYFF
ncbi:CRAL-TRIO domain-containing protein [Globomyces pollinis-pini]|nr:CRAL-TRIO domain-containing protein [Globomyces pollinis-pini]